MEGRGYTAEFRQRVLDLVAAGRRVEDVARDLGISDQTVYSWRRQDRVDRGFESGRTTAERADLIAARRRIRELETELAIHPRAAELLKGLNPKRFAAVEVMATERLPVKLACRVLKVLESGYFLQFRASAHGPRRPNAVQRLRQKTGLAVSASNVSRTLADGLVSGFTT